MEALAHVKYVRMSPRKVQLVCDMIRGLDVKTAAAYLNQTSKAACEPMAKLLKSAVANAEHNHGMNADSLYVSTVVANPGPRAEARPHRIQKRFRSDSQENHSHHHRCEREGLTGGYYGTES